MIENFSEVTFLGMPKSKPQAKALPGWSLIATALSESVRQSGLSVTAVAKRAGMSRQYLYNMMDGGANPTMDQVEKAFAATGTTFDRWLNDRMMYGRDKSFHDKVQKILDNKGPRAVAVRVIVEDDNNSN